jgi:nitronate monooxygenase
MEVELRSRGDLARERAAPHNVCGVDVTLQDLFGIEYPIVQSPMAGVQDSGLALAVCNAGGLGSLPCAMLTPEGMEQELSTIARGTTRPFNVNFFCHPPPAHDASRERTWREALAPYYKELNLAVDDEPAAPGRGSFTHDAADALEPFKPPVVSFHFGLPSPDLLARVKSWGARVMSSATTVDEAIWLEARGVDAVIAQGLEAGGHRGLFLSRDLSTQVGTLALVPQIARAVTVPVIAAGGIADARGVRAALALGAAGVQVGTAYLLCPEARTTPIHRAALESAGARLTALTNVFTGRPARGIVNRIVRELGPINPHVPDFPLAVSDMLRLRAEAERRGSADFSPLWAGQNVSGCKAVPAEILTRELAG